jgi:hypothetical protein
MKIIGLGHYSRTGKDSLANYLLLALKRRKLTAVKRPFAWKLKDIAHQLYHWDGVQAPEHYDTATGERDRDKKLPTLGMTPVELWVKLGTPAIRNIIYDMTWVDYVLKTDHGVEVVIIPDVRFPNEVAAIRERNGTLIKVVRPDYGPKTEIDRALDDFDGWDAVVGKSGKLADLQAYARKLADWLKHGGDMPKE